jgi:hypothetical protein
MKAAELARQMFAAYNGHGENAWKTWDGRPVPPWESLTDDVRQKWIAAALAALYEMEREKEPVR